MKNSKKFIPILLVTSCLALSGCSALFKDLLSGFGSITDTETDDNYVDHFVNTNGETVYVYLNETEKTLLPGMQVKLNVDLAKEGQEPDFSGSWTGVKYKSLNKDVAVVDDSGMVTAINVGTARITAEIFSCKIYADITVIAKELDHVTIENARKTFIKNKEFVASFTLVANLKGDFTENIETYDVDSSAVDMTAVGNYPVVVSGTYLSKPFEASYTISVKDAVSYTPKNLDYNYVDLKNNRSNESGRGWCLPNSGNIKSLVIPVWFTNSGSMISDKAGMRNKIATAFNGNALDNGWNSVKSYYYALSNGTINYNATVSGWYEPGQAFTYYNDEGAWKQMIINAVDWYFENNPSETRKSYDSDHNGVFDSICIIYGSNESTQGMISFQNYYNKTDADHPGLKYVMWASAFDAADDTNHSEADSHVFIHETGHMFGLNDYYDYGADTRPAGGFNMQEHTTGSHEAFSITSLGWGKVIIPETDTIVELEDYESSHVSVLLSTHPESHNSPFDEYILLELFAPTGTKKFDATYHWKGFYSNGPQQPGVRVWHVDSRLAQRVGSSYSTDLLTDATTTDSTEAFSNTSVGTNHGSVLGEEYNKYSQLFNVRNNAPTEDYYGNVIKVIDETNLFRTGDSFNWNDFTNQFPEGNKMDSGEKFYWTFSVDSISTVDGKYVATINIERL